MYAPCSAVQCSHCIPLYLLPLLCGAGVPVTALNFGNAQPLYAAWHLVPHPINVCIERTTGLNKERQIVLSMRPDNPTLCSAAVQRCNRAHILEDAVKNACI